MITVKNSLPVPTPNASGSSVDDGGNYNDTSAGYNNNNSVSDSLPSAGYSSGGDNGFEDGSLKPEGK